jgi:thromboxane-A synthase
VIAGYETTSTALSYVVYLLATHSAEQLKLQEEIDARFDLDTEHTMPTYKTVSEMEYLDMVIKETLRMYPIAPSVSSRQSEKDFFIRNVGTIPAGTQITADVKSLHYNANLWGPVDPHIFYPERFATKRHQMAWIPFGAGPRICVGMRFALFEMKIALVRLLKTYSLVECGDDTRKPFEKLQETLVIAPTKIIVRLQRRDAHQE